MTDIIDLNRTLSVSELSDTERCVILHLVFCVLVYHCDLAMRQVISPLCIYRQSIHFHASIYMYTSRVTLVARQSFIFFGCCRCLVERRSLVGSWCILLVHTSGTHVLLSRRRESNSNHSTSFEDEAKGDTCDVDFSSIVITSNRIRHVLTRLMPK